MEIDGRELIRVLQRGADALERLAETPIIETEGGPPICPHCNTLNPEIKIPAAGESVGLLGLYALEAFCNTCNNVIFAVPIEWAMFQSVEGAEEELQRRAGILNGNGSD